VAQAYDRWFVIEKANRTKIEKSLQLLAKKFEDLDPVSNNLIARTMMHGETIDEDAHQCKFCTDFAYASMVYCHKCKT